MMRKIEYIEKATENEVREWMNQETARLGDWLTEFIIMWYCNSTKYWLEIWSQTRATRLNEKSGRHLTIGEVLTNEDWLALPIIQSKGRKLYYLLKNDFPVKRDLQK